jgi:hypothetical protein
VSLCIDRLTALRAAGAAILLAHDPTAATTEAHSLTLRLAALRHFHARLSVLFTKLRALREHVHGLTQKDAYVHNERDERTQREALHAMIDAEECRLRIEATALVDTTSTASDDAASHLASDASVLACFTHAAACLYAFGDEHAAAAPTHLSPSSATPLFFDERYFSGARLADVQRARIDAVLARFEGRDIDYHNFTPAAKVDLRDKEAARSANAQVCVDNTSVSDDIDVSSSTAAPTVSVAAEEEDDVRQASATQRSVYRCAITEVFVRNGVVSDARLVIEHRCVQENALAALYISACADARTNVRRRCAVLRSDQEYCRILIDGKSFMLHQIRKMMSLAVMCVRDIVNESMFDDGKRCHRVALLHHGRSTEADALVAMYIMSRSLIASPID